MSFLRNRAVMETYPRVIHIKGTDKLTCLDLEKAIAERVEHYNNERYRESVDNVTAAIWSDDVHYYFSIVESSSFAIN